MSVFFITSQENFLYIDFIVYKQINDEMYLYFTEHQKKDLQGFLEFYITPLVPRWWNW